jgi:hypothetical protein
MRCRGTRTPPPPSLGPSWEEELKWHKIDEQEESTHVSLICGLRAFVMKTPEAVSQRRNWSMWEGLKDKLFLKGLYRILCVPATCPGW